MRLLQDALPTLNSSEKTQFKPLELAPRMGAVLLVLGMLQRARAEHALLSGDDPRPLLQAAQETVQRLADLQPKNQSAWADLAAIEMLAARYELLHGGLATQARAAAGKHLALSAEID